MELPEIKEAYAFHEGDIICLRMTRDFSSDQTRQILELLKESGKQAGVNFILLSRDLEVVPNPNV